MKKRIIITGGNGQDGIILTKLLIKKKYSIYSFINKQKFSKIKSVKYYNINLTNQKIVEQTLNNIKPIAIVHLASKNSSTIKNKSMKYDLFYKKNLLITKNLINSIPKIKKKIKFIFAGSSLMFSKTTGKVNESSKFKANCYYSKYKIDAHNYLMFMKKKFKLFATTAILFNHDSKYRNSKFLFPRLVNYLKNKKFNLIRDIYKQNIIGDFSHAEDVCDGFYSLILSKKNPDKIIFSSNQLSKVNDIINFSFKKLKIKKSLPKPKKSKIRLIGNNSLGKKLLKWKPKKNSLMAFNELLENML